MLDASTVSAFLPPNGFQLATWRSDRGRDRKGWREGGREGGREGERETGRQGDRERGRQGERETGREGDRERGRQGERETGREGPVPKRGVIPSTPEAKLGVTREAGRAKGRVIFSSRHTPSILETKGTYLNR